jgi:SprT protein
MNTEHVRKVEDKVLECCLLLQEKLSVTLELPTIIFRQLGRRAGCATYSKNKIELNSDFFNNGHADDMINQTLPHEIAHLVASVKYGEMGRGHGYWWKHVMGLLGLTPNRCHCYSMENVKTKNPPKFVYRCGCRSEIFFTKIRHNRHQSGRHYFCKMCGKQLQFVGMKVAVVPRHEEEFKLV